VDSRTVLGCFCRERVACDDAIQFFRGAEDDVYKSARMLRESRAEFARDFRRRAFSVEDSIAALDVGLDVLITKPLQQRAKGGHGELSMAAHIYRTQQRNEGRHIYAGCASATAPFTVCAAK
jgi:hypothetical protein